jgi:hypothetical protein
MAAYKGCMKEQEEKNNKKRAAKDETVGVQGCRGD